MPRFDGITIRTAASGPLAYSILITQDDQTIVLKTATRNGVTAGLIALKVRELITEHTTEEVRMEE